AETELEITPSEMEKWAEAGWIDLRTKNWEMWISRINAIVDEAELIPEDDTSSLHVRTEQYWNYFKVIDVGKVVSWIFINEEKGNRMKD
ncbi:MAG: short-chain dehydrogenase, partial [Ignavibacteriaceae bacterium]|nr:short-chain dehydrogenase [Ignavibacteriaceae bacterium]